MEAEMAVKVKKIGKVYRFVDAKGKVVKGKDGKPLDKGGYLDLGAAVRELRHAAV